MMADVGCAGILVEDTFCGHLQELPREGQLVAIDSMPSKAGGCASNVAIGLAKQGITTDVVGCLGKDASAKVLLDSFEKHRVGCSHLIYSDSHPTSKTVILLIEGQDRRYIHMFGANKVFSVRHVDRDWLARLKVFYLGGLFAMPTIKMDELVDLLKFCRTRKVITVVDVVVPQQFSGIDELKPLLPWIDFFLPNNDEAQQMTGRAGTFEQIHTLHAQGAHTVIITQGKNGAVAARGEKFWRCGTDQLQVVDPSGSGDAFACGVITGILHGWDIPETLRYASALGASATRAVGTTDGVFTAQEAESFIASHPMKIISGSLEP